MYIYILIIWTLLTFLLLKYDKYQFGAPQQKGIIYRFVADLYCILLTIL